jgi:hypothetical protein
MCISALRNTRNKFILSLVAGAIGLAQFITGGVLSLDVYSWSISFFGIITGLVGLGYMGYILRNRSNVSAEIAFGLCCSIMLVNIQGAFVLGACSDSLVETFAMTIISYYDEFVLEVYTSQCSACINSEENIEDAVINAIHQLFAAEYTFVVLSILQTFVMACGCISYLDNQALNKLGLLPVMCISSDVSVEITSPRGEAGFDEL